MNWIKDLIRRPKVNTEYTIVDSFEDINDQQYLINKTISKEIDGFIIRDAISKDQIDFIIDNFEKIPENLKTALPNSEGVVYPLPYSMVHSSELREAYFTKLLCSDDTFTQEITLHPKNFFVSILSAYTTYSIEVISAFENQKFPTINCRKLTSNSTGLSIHCENSFLHQLDSTFREHLLKNVDLYNQLSFFFVVKKQADSGDIVLYSREWETFDVKNADFSDTDQKSDDLRFFKMNKANNVSTQNIHLNEGDLFIFRAGQIWHRVKNVNNSGDRMTIGGFLAKSNTSEGINFWA